MAQQLKTPLSLDASTYVGVFVPFLYRCVCLPLFSSSKSFSISPPTCTNHFCLDPTLDGRDQIRTTALLGELSCSGGCLESWQWGGGGGC